MKISKRLVATGCAVFAAVSVLGGSSVASAGQAALLTAADVQSEFPGVQVDSSFDASHGVEVVGHGSDGLSGAIPAAASAGQPRVSDCERWRNAVALPGQFINSVPGCALIGTSKNTVVFYSWSRTGGSSGSTGCVQGKGFNALGKPVWQNAGCATTSGNTAILWGNVAATKQVRMHTTLGNNMQFQWR